MQRIVLAVLISAMATPAFAHAGHGAHTFTEGVVHPLGGFDHMLAAFAVGLWAVLSGTKRPFVFPAAFIAAMIAGTVLGAQGVRIPYIEPGIAASVLVLGLLAALAVSANAWAGAAVVAIFALLHGHAHGAEGGAALPYLAGLIAGTAILHVAGVVVALGSLSARRPILARALGGAIAVGGAFMLLGVVA